MPRRKRKYVFYPISLTCKDTEDFGADELFMRFGGIEKNIGSMDEDSPAYEFNENQEYGFNKTLTVELWDRDTGVLGDQDDLLGSVTIDATTTTFDEEITAEFTENCRYVFVYEVGKNEASADG